MTACGPVDAEICGEQGAIITAAAYLDAHYQLDSQSCNSQVAIPWVWLVRFAAELAHQSASKALHFAADGHLKDWGLVRVHSFDALHSEWVRAGGKNATDRSKRQSFKDKAKALRALFGPIDSVDPRGLMLRYPVSHPRNAKWVPAIPPRFAEHCDWPILLRKLIARICDLTIERLSPERQACRNAFGFLRATAAAGFCLGDYLPSTDVFHGEWEYSDHVVVPYMSIPEPLWQLKLNYEHLLIPDDGHPSKIAAGMLYRHPTT